MGSTESKSQYLQRVEKLASGYIPSGEEAESFWNEFWSCYLSEDDVFSILHDFLLRTWKVNHPDSLMAFFHAVIDKLADKDTAPEVKDRCIWILTRLLPFSLEAEAAQPEELTFASKYLFESSDMAVNILDVILKAFFAPGYTVSDKATDEDVLNRSWAPGVFVDKVGSEVMGSWSPYGNLDVSVTNKRRTYVVRSLLVSCCGDLFCSNDDILLDAGRSDSLGRVLLALTQRKDATTQALFASLFNTICSFDPVALSASAEADELVHVCVELLDVLLTWKHFAKDGSSIRTEKNVFIEMLSKIEDEKLLSFIAFGIIRLINFSVPSQGLFGGRTVVSYYRELLVLLWAVLTENSRIARVVASSDEFTSLLITILFFIYQGKQNGTLTSVIHLCGVILLSLSEFSECGVALSKACPSVLPFTLPNVVPGESKLIDVIVSIMSVLFSAVSEYDSLMEMFFIFLNNCASKICGISTQSSQKLVSLLFRVARPKFLVQSPRNSFILSVSINLTAILLQSNPKENHMFVYTVLENQKLFRRIASMTPKSLLEAAVAVPKPKDGEQPTSPPKLPWFATEQWCEKWIPLLQASKIVEVIDYLLKETENVCQGVDEDQQSLMKFLTDLTLPEEMKKASFQIHKYMHSLTSARWTLVLVWSILVTEAPLPNPFRCLIVSLFVPAVKTANASPSAFVPSHEQYDGKKSVEGEKKEEPASGVTEDKKEAVVEKASEEKEVFGKEEQESKESAMEKEDEQKKEEQEKEEPDEAKPVDEEKDDEDKKANDETVDAAKNCEEKDD